MTGTAILVLTAGVHLRDGEVLKDTVRDIHATWWRHSSALPAPSTGNRTEAGAYRERILGRAAKRAIRPLMALYLTDNTTPGEIRKRKRW